MGLAQTRSYDIIINILGGKSDAKKIEQNLRGTMGGMQNAVQKFHAFGKLGGMTAAKAAEGAAMAMDTGQYMMSPGGTLHQLTPMGHLAGPEVLQGLTGQGEEGYRQAAVGGLLKPMSDSAAANTFRGKLVAAGKTVKGFRMEMLSAMFAGQQLSATFGSMVTSVLDMFGVSKIFKVLIMTLLIPALKPLIPYIYGFMKAIMNLPEWVRKLIGSIIIGIAIFGALIAIVATLVLLISGFAAAFGTGVGEMLLVLVGFASVIIAVITALIYFWDQIMWLASLPAQIGSNLGKQLGIPQLAGGGIISSPTLAMVGEKGPEAIVPLGGNSGFMNGTVNVNANVSSNIDINILARRIFDELQILQANAYSSR